VSRDSYSYLREIASDRAGPPRIISRGLFRGRPGAGGATRVE